jgi:hypothetical protein
MSLKSTDLFENHPVPSWICDPKTMAIDTANKAAVRFFVTRSNSCAPKQWIN